MLFQRRVASNIKPLLLMPLGLRDRANFALSPAKLRSSVEQASKRAGGSAEKCEPFWAECPGIVYVLCVCIYIGISPSLSPPCHPQGSGTC